MAYPLQETKFNKLAEAIGWVDTLPKLEELLRQFIPRIEDEKVREAMWRFYILNESQRVDDFGKPINKEERLFYTRLQIGRTALQTVFNISSEELKALQKLRREGVY